MKNSHEIPSGNPKIPRIRRIPGHSEPGVVPAAESLRGAAVWWDFCQEMHHGEVWELALFLWLKNGENMSKSSIKSIKSEWSSMGSCRFSAPQVAAMIGQKMGRGHMERLVTRQQGSHGSSWLVGWYMSISRNSPTSSHFYWWIATRTSYPIKHAQDVSIDSGSIDMGWEWMGIPDLCSSQAGTLVDVALMDGDAVPAQLGDWSSSGAVGDDSSHGFKW